MKNNQKEKIIIIGTIQNAHTIRWSGILIEKGYDVTVVTTEKKSWSGYKIPTIECIARTSKYAPMRLILSFLHAFQIGLIVKRCRPDIIHIHSLDYVHPFCVGFIDFITGWFQPMVISTWGTDVISVFESNVTLFGKYSKKFLLKRAKKVTATTFYLAELTARLLPADKEVDIIPFGIDCEMFKPNSLKQNNEKVQIGFIKHLTHKYGPEYLVKAMALVIATEPKTHLTIVGHGELESHLKKLVIDLDINNNVSFTGHIQYKSIPEMMKKFDIFVMPTADKEAFGVVAIEAQAMQIPVIATNVGGIKEAVLDGVTGILVEPRNCRQLAKAILRLIASPEEREAMGKYGRKFVLLNYDIETSFLSMKNVYNHLLNLN